MDYGKKLREYRNEKGLSQREMAGLLGVAQSVLCLYESGKNNPGKEVAEKIDTLLGKKPTLKERTPGEAPQAIIEKDEAKKEVEEVEEEEDMINSPKHYQIPGCNFESIKLITAFSEELPGDLGYIAGNVVKYLVRAEKKDGKRDYEKAKKYLTWAIDCNYIGGGDLVEEISASLGTDWFTIISGICTGMEGKKALLLNETFNYTAECDYKTALTYLNKILELY